MASSKIAEKMHARSGVEVSVAKKMFAAVEEEKKVEAKLETKQEENVEGKLEIKVEVKAGVGSKGVPEEVFDTGHEIDFATGGDGEDTVVADEASSVRIPSRLGSEGGPVVADEASSVRIPSRLGSEGGPVVADEASIFCFST